MKVLDFGLAKALEPVEVGRGDVTASPTITSPALTQIGMILGTAAYLSPEQVKGRPADKRSDCGRSARSCKKCYRVSARSRAKTSRTRSRRCCVRRST